MVITAIYFSVKIGLHKGAIFLLGAVDGEPRVMVRPDHAGLRGITGVVKGTNKIIVTGWTG